MSNDSLIDLPDRPSDAPSGSDFLAAAIAQWERPVGAGHPSFSVLLRQREEAIVAEVLRGNVPTFARRLWEVTVTSDAPAHTGVLRVAADYLCIGADDDFVRIPLSPISAQRIAARLGCTLPTKKLVDAIYSSEATRRQTAVPMPPPGPEMVSLARAGAHHEKIEAQRVGDLGDLVAGHKKDVVLAGRLATTPERVAIYGFHRADGAPWQPLQLPHPDWYSDYSHGIRLVRDTMTVDGEEQPVADVLRHPEWCRLLTEVGDPGPYAVTAYVERDLPEEASP